MTRQAHAALAVRSHVENLELGGPAVSVSGDWLVLGVLEREQDLNGDGDTRHARSGFQALYLGGIMEKLSTDR